MKTPSRTPSVPGPPDPPQEVWQRPFVKAHQKWCDDFVIELRLRDAPGRTIGEYLGEVEAHCAESGETPTEAFGDPAGYARQIDAGASPDRTSGIWAITGIAAAQVLAMLVGTSAVRFWALGENLTLNAVQLACLALVVVALLCLPRLLRPLVRHPLRMGLLLAGVVGGGGVAAAASAQWDLPAVLNLPAPVAAVGLFAVVLLLAWAEYRELNANQNDGPVISPLTPTGGGVQRPGGQRWAAIVPSSLIPITYLALGTFNWVFYA